jgi:pilus assembly protein CpaB
MTVERRWLDWAKKLLLPIALGVVTVVGVDYYLTAKSEALDQVARTQLKQQLVARMDLQAGMLLEIDHVAIRDVPLQWVGPDGFSADDVDHVIGKRLLRSVVGGEPLSRSALSDPEPLALKHQISPGRRAVTIPVDHVSSLSGRLAPGDVVDLFVTFLHEGRRITTLLMASVPVLSTDRPVLAEQLPMENPSSRLMTAVTLEVTPSQALKLIAANLDGVITAVLRIDASLGDATSSAADHLAGFVGVEPSYGTARAPQIIYGDSTSDAPEQP